jgi:hypothetical protein
MAIMIGAVMLLAWPAAAQKFEGEVRGAPSTTANLDEAIQVGPFLFSPAFELSWQDRDNIFFTPDNEVADQLWLARARLLFELPIYESYVRFSYTPQYRDFVDYELEDKWGHFFNAAGGFQFANGMTLDVVYDYIIGNLETREVDPGGELVFGDRNFTKNFASVELGYWFGPRDGLTVRADWTDIQYDEPELFFPYSRVFAALGWKHQINPVLVMDLEYGHTEFDAEDFADVDNSFRDSSSDQATVGLRGQLSPVVTTELRVGYRQTSYDVLPGDPPTEDFKGVIADGFISWDLAHGGFLRFDAVRSDYPSNFAREAYYVATGGTLSYNIDRGRLFGQLLGRYQSNDYELPNPATGTVRSDNITMFGAGLGYRFSSLLSLRGAYLYEDRDSNIYNFGYTSNTFTLGLLVGY